MGHSNPFYKNLFNRNLERKANEWFDQTNDRQPFDAFGSADNKRVINEDVFKGIQEKIKKNNSLYFFLKFTGVVVIFLTIGITVSQIINQHLREQSRIVWSEYKSLPGHLSKILLSDSSIVYLRPGSILKTPQEFNGKFREIQLVEGEAFFEVKHDREHPFIVRSGSFKIQVLGTTFRIKNYHQLKNFQVSVATGKVAVMNGKTLLGLFTSRQELNFNIINSLSVTSETDINAEAWKKGEYALQNASMHELALVLEKIYGLKILFRSQDIRNSAITIQFNMNDRIQNVLDQLKLIHHLKYIVKNKEVVLMK